MKIIDRLIDRFFGIDPQAISDEEEKAVYARFHRFMRVPVLFLIFGIPFTMLSVLMGWIW